MRSCFTFAPAQVNIGQLRCLKMLFMHSIVTFRTATTLSKKLPEYVNIRLTFCCLVLWTMPKMCPYSTVKLGTVRKELNKPACQPPSQCPQKTKSPYLRKRRILFHLIRPRTLLHLSFHFYKLISLRLLCAIPERWK